MTAANILIKMFHNFAMGGYIVRTAVSFVCCWSIRDIEKVMFSDNF